MWCGVREYLHTVLPLLEWCAIPVACGVKGRNQDQGGFLCAVGSQSTRYRYPTRAVCQPCGVKVTEPESRWVSMWCEVTEYKLPLLEQCSNPAGSKDGTRVGFYLVWGHRVQAAPTRAVCQPCRVKGRNQDQDGFLFDVGSQSTRCPCQSSMPTLQGQRTEPDSR